MYSGLQTLQLCVCGAKWGHLFCFNKAGVFLGSDCQAANCFPVTSHVEESSLSRGPTLHRRWPSGLVARGYSRRFCFHRKAKHVTLFAPLEPLPTPPQSQWRTREAGGSATASGAAGLSSTLCSAELKLRVPFHHSSTTERSERLPK